MNEVEKPEMDLEEAKQGVLEIIHENRYATLGAGVLAAIGAMIKGTAGSAAGGAVGGLVGHMLDRRAGGLQVEQDSIDPCDDDYPVYEEAP